MEDIVEACEHEFLALSKLQHEMHNASSRSESIQSIFSGAISERLWYSTTPIKMEVETQNDIVKYIVLNTFHYLSHVYMVQKLPALKVKKAYNDTIQICWPHNVANNVTKLGEFKVNETKIQTIDNKWLDDFLQFFTESGREQWIAECQGNIPELEDWNNFLPEYDLTPIQPFFIDNDDNTAFPIFKIDRQHKIHFRYKLRRNFRKLLRMRKLIEGKWCDIPFNKNYIEGNYGSDILPEPELWGIYYKVTEPELNSNLNCEGDDGVRSNEMIVLDVIPIKGENLYTYGKSPTIPLVSDQPVKAFTFKAQKKDYLKSRNYSNYTTEDEVRKGFSPIDKVNKFCYGTANKMKDIGIHHTSRIFPFYHCTRTPFEKGYNIVSLCSKIDDSSFDTAVILSNLKAELKLSFRNMDPKQTKIYIYNKDSKSKQQDEPIGLSFSSSATNKKHHKEIDESIIDFDDKPIGKKKPTDQVESEIPTSEDSDEYIVEIRLIVMKIMVFIKDEKSNYYKIILKKHVS